jgi:hypothetical protein
LAALIESALGAAAVVDPLVVGRVGEDQPDRAVRPSPLHNLDAVAHHDVPEPVLRRLFKRDGALRGVALRLRAALDLAFRLGDGNFAFEDLLKELGVLFEDELCVLNIAATNAEQGADVVACRACRGDDGTSSMSCRFLTGNGQFFERREVPNGDACLLALRQIPMHQLGLHVSQGGGGIALKLRHDRLAVELHHRAVAVAPVENLPLVDLDGVSLTVDANVFEERLPLGRVHQREQVGELVRLELHLFPSFRLKAPRGPGANAPGHCVVPGQDQAAAPRCDSNASRDSPSARARRTTLCPRIDGHSLRSQVCSVQYAMPASCAKRVWVLPVSSICDRSQLPK